MTPMRSEDNIRIAPFQPHIYSNVQENVRSSLKPVDADERISLISLLEMRREAQM